MHEESRRRLASIAERWDALEERLKQVELFRREAVLAAVNELRYTGRRIADAMLIASDTSLDDAMALRKIDEHVIVAENYFINADHDLTDAVVLHVLVNFSRVVKRHGLQKTKKHLKEYDNYSAILDEARSLVETSRGDRARRTEIYAQLAKIHVPALIELQRLLDSVSELAIPDSEIKRSVRVLTALAVIGSIASIISLFFSIWIWVVTPSTADLGEIVANALQRHGFIAPGTPPSAVPK